MRQAIDWSYDLLGEGERTLFTQLGVFSGGFTLESADTVCSDGGLDVDTLLLALVDKSLVAATKAAGRTRYRLLELLQQYALERLEESGDGDFVRRRHAEYYAGFIAEADEKLKGHDEARWVEIVKADYANLRAATQWCIDTREVDLALSVVGHLRFYTYNRMIGDLPGWAEEVLELPGAAERDMFGPATAAVATIVNFTGDPERARRLVVRALEAERVHSLKPSGQLRGVASATHGASARMAEAVAFAEQGAKIDDVRFSDTERAIVFAGCSFFLSAVGRDADGEQWMAHGREMADRIGNPSLICWAYSSLARWLARTDLDAARDAAEIALAAGEPVGQIVNTPMAVQILASYETQTGNPERAFSLMVELVRTMRRQGLRFGVLQMIRTQLPALVAASEFQASVTLAEALGDRGAAGLQGSAETATEDDALRAAHSALDEAAFEECRTRGAGMGGRRTDRLRAHRIRTPLWYRPGFCAGGDRQGYSPARITEGRARPTPVTIKS